LAIYKSSVVSHIVISNSRAILVLVLAAIISGSVIVSSELNIIKYAAATTSAVIIPSDNSHNNATSSFGMLVTVPFYQSIASNIIGQRVTTTANGLPQIEQSSLENGTMQGVGNVTDLETWTNTFVSPGIVHGVGQGVMTTADGQVATWTATGIGRSNADGVIIYHDVIIFNTNSNGNLAFLKNLEALSITVVNGTKQTRMMWEWK
jgi:hypothetical protein